MKPLPSSVDGLPPGATATFNPSSVSAGGTTTLNITTSTTTPVDRYPVTVIASSGAQQSWATILLNVTNAPAPPRFNVIDLGTLGGISSEAWGLNDAGDVTGWANIANGQKRAFRYSNGVMTDLGTLGGTESIGYGINSAGDVVGSSKNASGTQRAFRWSGGLMQDLGTIDGSASAATARAINNAGQIVGYSTYQDGSTEAFIWNNGSMSGLGRLGYTSFAFAVNASGQAAGWGQLSNGAARAYRYSGGTVQNLGVIVPSSFDGSYGYGMNDAGQVVGAGTYGSTTATHAALFSGGAVQDLGTLGGTESLAWGISGSNQIVGYSTNSGAVRRAFLYENSMVDLNSLISPAAAWVLSEARAINNAGQIVGSGVINGATHAFLLTPSTGSATHHRAQRAFPQGARLGRRLRHRAPCLWFAGNREPHRRRGRQLPGHHHLLRTRLGQQRPPQHQSQHRLCQQLRRAGQPGDRGLEWRRQRPNRNRDLERRDQRPNEC